MSAPATISSLREWETASVKSMVAACSDYLQALSVMCNAGLTLVRHFVEPPTIAALMRPARREEAQRVRAAWEETGRSTRHASWTLRTGTLRALEEWLCQKEEEQEQESGAERCEAADDHGRMTDGDGAADLSKLLNSCLVAVLQLQHQFSIMVAPSSNGNQKRQSSPTHRYSNNGGGQSAGGTLDPSSAALHQNHHLHHHNRHLHQHANNHQSKPCGATSHHHHHNNQSSSSSNQHHTHNHQTSQPSSNLYNNGGRRPSPTSFPPSLVALATYNAYSAQQQQRRTSDDSNEEQEDDGPCSQDALLLQARRSSYGGGRTSVPSPPPAQPPGAGALGRRWSVPGGDSALEEGWTREMQRRGGGTGHANGNGRVVGGGSTSRPPVQPSSSHQEGGRAILGTGRNRPSTAPKKKGGGCPITKEELDDAINLLSSGGPTLPRAPQPSSACHPLSVLLPPPPPPPTHHPPPGFFLPGQRILPDGFRRGSWQGGLLSVATTPSSPPTPSTSPGHEGKSRSEACNSWGAAVHRPNQSTLSPASPKPVSPTAVSADSCIPPLANGTMSAGGETGVDSEGAFSIGLDLVGSSLVASVQQRAGAEETNDSISPTDKACEDENLPSEETSQQNGATSTAGPNGTWHPSTTQSTAAQPSFLPFPMNAASSRPTIWTPSSKDYARAPQPPYQFQIGPQ